MKLTMAGPACVPLIAGMIATIQPDRRAILPRRMAVSAIETRTRRKAIQDRRASVRHVPYSPDRPERRGPISLLRHYYSSPDPRIRALERRKP